MSPREKEWAWVGVLVGLLTIGAFIAAISSAFASATSRIDSLESGEISTKEDIKYIRNRVDDIYDRLPQR